MKFIIKIIVSVILFVAGILSEEPYSSGLKISAIVMFVTVVFIDGIIPLIQNRDRIILLFKSKYLALLGQDIRFSMSYQYIIKIDDKYLLVKNSNPSWEWYQHVGGKYKRLPETKKVLEDLGGYDDRKMKTDGLKKDDLAVFIPAKNAIRFLRWFETGSDREVSHWREFYEEMIDHEAKEGFLPAKIFPYVNYKLLKTIRTPLFKNKESGWDCWELLQYEVLELLPNGAQLEELKKLKERGDTSKIKWADASLINQLGYNTHEKEREYKIGEHAKWVMNLKCKRK